MTTYTKTDLVEYFRSDAMPHIWDQERGRTDKKYRREMWEETIKVAVEANVVAPTARGWSPPKWINTLRPSHGRKRANPNLKTYRPLPRKRGKGRAARKVPKKRVAHGIDFHWLDLNPRARFAELEAKRPGESELRWYALVEETGSANRDNKYTVKVENYETGNVWKWEYRPSTGGLRSRKRAISVAEAFVIRDNIFDYSWPDIQGYQTAFYGDAETPGSKRANPKKRTNPSDPRWRTRGDVASAVFDDYYARIDKLHTGDYLWKIYHIDDAVEVKSGKAPSLPDAKKYAEFYVIRFEVEGWKAGQPDARRKNPGHARKNPITISDSDVLAHQAWHQMKYLDQIKELEAQGAIPREAARDMRFKLYDYIDLLDAHDPENAVGPSGYYSDPTGNVSQSITAYERMKKRKADRKNPGHARTNPSHALAKRKPKPVRRRKKSKALTPAQRGRLSKSKFIFPKKAPGSGSYPIPDKTHARSALGFATMAYRRGNMSERDLNTVFRTVLKKFPSTIEWPSMHRWALQKRSS